MSKPWKLLFGLILATPLLAQSPATMPVTGWCHLGGSQAAVSGLQSANYQQGMIPGCTVTVYLHGTQTLATIYADDNNTPLSNPFTANVVSSPDSGAWIFWAASGNAYDVVGSGGVSPNTYPSPVTLMEIYLGGGGGGGGGCDVSGLTLDVVISNNPIGTCYGDANFIYTISLNSPTVIIGGSTGASLNVIGKHPDDESGDGSSADPTFTVYGGKGGNTTGVAGQIAGAGADNTINAGEGGDADSGSSNGDGGFVYINGGRPGSGSGDSGFYGPVWLQQENAPPTRLVHSPILTGPANSNVRGPVLVGLGRCNPINSTDMFPVDFCISYIDDLEDQTGNGLPAHDVFDVIGATGGKTTGTTGQVGGTGGGVWIVGGIGGSAPLGSTGGSGGSIILDGGYAGDGDPAHHGNIILAPTGGQVQIPSAIALTDTTHNGILTLGHSDGTAIDYAYSFAPSPTLGETYGEAVPDAAPTQVGQARVISSMTPVEITTSGASVYAYPETWVEVVKTSGNQAVTFSDLSSLSPVAGDMVFCSDCSTTTASTCSTNSPTDCICASSGTGAWAKYMNYEGGGSNWYCQ